MKIKTSMIKKLSIIVLVSGIPLFQAYAQLTPQDIVPAVPNKMSYQAIIRNSSNQLVCNQTVGIRISILKGAPDGTAIYTETQSPTTHVNGLVSIEIGGQAGFNAINWTHGPYFIKTETDPSGGTNYTITGTSPLLTVPYAQYALKADSANKISNDAFSAYDDLIDEGKLEGKFSDLLTVSAANSRYVTINKVNCCFRAIGLSNQTLTANTDVKVRYGTGGFDRGFCFDYQNNAFIAPYNGYYQFSAFVYVAELGEQDCYLRLFLRINNNYDVPLDFDVVNSIGNSGEGVNGSTILLLSSQDRVELYIHLTEENGKIAQYGSLQNYFCGHILP